jgi:hypothetical protein
VFELTEFRGSGGAGKLCRLHQPEMSRSQLRAVLEDARGARPVGSHGGRCCGEHTRSPGSMLSSTYRSSPGSGRPLGGFLPLDLALDFLLQLGRQIGFENRPTEALHALFDLLPPLRIGTTQQNQAGRTWL